MTDTPVQPVSQRKGSIAASLFLLSAGWLIVALVATAFLLTELYSRALDNSLVETLEFHVETLTDLSLLSDTPKSDQIKVADPRFDRTGSGWYWAIRDDKGELLNFSNSYVGMVLGPAHGRCCQGLCRCRASSTRPTPSRRC